MKRFMTLPILAVAALSLCAAKPIDNAKALYEQGHYQSAVDALRKILKSSPKDITANYYLGLSLLALGQNHDAISALEKAEDRGSTSASMALAQLAFDEYRMDDASVYIDRWERQLRKNKKAVPEQLDEMRSRVVMAKNMLQRVDKIAIIDSIVVDKNDFFTYYKLSSDAGKLLDGSILPRQYANEKPAVVYEPENNKEVFWAAPDSTGMLSLMSAQILDDGTLEAPKPFGEGLGEGGDADYMCLAADGVTFYFANNGENSLGGYDIFLSRRDPDGSTLQPQNMGMPYNSPYDDYMLVIDEAAGLGWWATDRNQIEDKVTIYTFVASPTRVNYDPDDDNLADYAFVRNIAATQGPGQNKSLIANNPALAAKSADNASDEFEISMGNGKVYTSLDQFKSSQARQSMKQYLARVKDLKMMRAELDAMRRRYAAGDQSVQQDILSLEKRILSAESMLLKLRNAVIEQEGL